MSTTEALEILTANRYAEIWQERAAGVTTATADELKAWEQLTNTNDALPADYREGGGK